MNSRLQFCLFAGCDDIETQFQKVSKQKPEATYNCFVCVFYVFLCCLSDSHSNVLFPCSKATLNKKSLMCIFLSLSLFFYFFFFFLGTVASSGVSKHMLKSFGGSLQWLSKKFSLVAYGHILFEWFLSQAYQMDFLHITSQSLLQNALIQLQQYFFPLAIVIWTLQLTFQLQFSPLAESVFCFFFFSSPGDFLSVGGLWTYIIDTGVRYLLFLGVEWVRERLVIFFFFFWRLANEPYTVRLT